MASNDPLTTAKESDWPFSNKEGCTAWRTVTTAMMLGWAAATPAAEGIQECLDQARHPDIKDRSACLKQTGDPKAIGAAYALAREMVATEGRRAVSRDGFWFLAADAGDVAAWTDLRLLLEKARSQDAIDQIFGLEALRHSMLALQLGPSNRLKERLERLREINPEIRAVCASRVSSEDERVRETAKDCIDVADSEPPSKAEDTMGEIMEEERAARERGVSVPSPFKPFRVFDEKGRRVGGGLISDRADPARLRCLHDALGAGLELCIEPATVPPDEVQSRRVVLQVREQAGGSSRNVAQGWVDEGSEGARVANRGGIVLHPGDTFLRDPPPPIDLAAGHFLIYVPIVRPWREGGPHDGAKYQAARAFLALYDREQRVLKELRAPPGCINGCPATRLQVIKGAKGKLVKLTLGQDRWMRVYRYQWRKGQLESLDD